MVTLVLAAVGRFRRVILVVGLVLSAGYVLAQHWVPLLGQRAFPVLFAALAVLLVLGGVSASRLRPRSFVVRPDVPAFSTPPQPMLVFLALAFLIIGTGRAGNVVRDWAVEPFFPDQSLELAHVCLVLLFVVLAWRNTGVQLRPDGLWQQSTTGRIVVPWEALPAVPALPPDPNARTVPLTFGRPELVRRYGLRPTRHRLRTEDIDPRLITAAVRFYAAHPERRPVIGTAAEYDRVFPQLLDPPSDATGDRWE